MKKLILIALALTAFACESKPAPTPPAAAPEPAKPVAEAPKAPEIPDDAVPVVTDFEAAAETEITADNYGTVLDEIEKGLAEAPAE